MQIIPDHLVLYLQLKVLGTLFSAIAYGIVAVLSGNCLYLLQRKRGIQSYRMRTLLLIYVTVMLILSTLTLFQLICQVIGFMFPPEILPAGLMYLPITLALTTWGENGFMVRIIIPYQEQRFTVLQIWRGIISYQDASNRPRILINVLLSLLSLASSGRSISISTPLIQVTHENIRMRGHGVSQGGYGLLNIVHITLPSRKYHTRSTNCFPTHLPSKALPRYSWRRTWISLYQHYDDVGRTVSPSCHFKWHIHCPDLRPAPTRCILGAYPVPTSPSYLCRWPETP